MELGIRFYRSDNHTIMSGLVVRYKVLSDRLNGEISASREGVLISNLPHLTNIQEVLDVQRVIGRAYEQYNALYKSNPALAFFTDPPCVVELRKYQVMSQEYIVLKERAYEPFAAVSVNDSPPHPARCRVAGGETTKED